jgi:dihydroxyacetone kinase-like protein
MKSTLNFDDFDSMIHAISATIQENSDFLCELDSVVGDGDHGTTIARGLRKAIEAIDEQKPETISDLMSLAGNTMIESMGGASGPIFGSLFRQMGRASRGKEEVNLSDLADMYEKAANKIMQLGGAEPGQKTMIDSLVPAVESLKASAEAGENVVDAYKKMHEAALAGVEATKEMVAKQGRARYAGERGMGYQDAGATSVSMMIGASYKALS